MEINKEDIINRITHMRKDMLGITGRKLSEISNTDWSTIKKWENGLTAFTTKTTIFKIAKCFNDAGIYVSEDWILFGKGPKPKKYSEIKKTNFNYEEEELFKSRIKSLGHKCAIVSILGEDAMYPVVEHSDRIGCIIYSENFEKYVGQFCLVRFNGEQEMFRKLQLQQGAPAGFELVTLNSPEIIVPDTIEWVAPLVRRWKYQF
ncbi:MAG: helix-turn-helix transcriptional regulator [Bdellovibrionota bacterium]